MLTSDTKRHIDAARQVLVGIVPDPKGQVDQITNALIYKFMDDMDQSAIRAGGKASFFVKDLEKYSWTSLMSPQLGNQEKMNMYVEAIAKFGDAKQLPDLFRDIFKRAFLPYRDPETLVLFLKEISYFSYSHSEELGNAYEYLLSIMGSQGDAGQFRTPRHIIDFMVAVVDPNKDDTLLDPACGTAGFLISAYKHILAKHDGKDNQTGKRTGAEKPLTPDERRKVMEHFTGYDISPDMVRMSQVNMYLHAFKKPKIYEYNTLASDDRWNEKFDVILANPPFMSPQGGVRPHNKFSVESSRAEVLFVDYIMTHLKPRGRGGIIVPEGVIFQSGSAYKKLRKLLIEDGLYAVASLPSGVFNPYSGVKTSILFFDNQCAQKSGTVLFVNIKNTGVGLGAAKKEIVGSDLPEALRALHAHRNSILGNGPKVESPIAFTVKRNLIEKNRDYNFSGDRYRVMEKGGDGSSAFVALSDVAEIEKGKSSSTKTVAGPFPLILTAEVPKTSENYDFEGDAVCVPLISATGHGKASVKRVHRVSGKFALANLLAAIFPKKESLNTNYLYWILTGGMDRLASLMSGAANVSMKKEDLEAFKIPLPSLDTQIQVAAEMQNYSDIITGAERIIESWKPKIEIDSSWKIVKISDVCEVNPKKSELKKLKEDADVSFVPMADMSQAEMFFETKQIKKLSEVVGSYTYFAEGDVVVARVTPCFENRKSGIARNLKNKIGFGSSEYIVLRPSEKVLPEIIYAYLQSDAFLEAGKSYMTGTGGLQRVPVDFVSNWEIALPPLEMQKEIVEKVESERLVIEANRNLLAIYQEKIKNKLASLWDNN